jgi:ribonuclease-3
MDKGWDRPLSDFEQRIGYLFTDKSLLAQALTHSTYAYENKSRGMPDNERLEFLGDSILGLAIGRALFEDDPALTEGDMTAMRALVVCEQSLAEAARRIGLGRELLLGVGEDRTGGRDKDSNLSNAMEALFGAAFLDGGYDQASSLVLRLMRDILDRALAGKLIRDYKSRLIEWAQAFDPPRKVEFVLVRETGREHERMFTSRVEIDSVFYGEGAGKSKKESEQAASREARRLRSPD